MFKNARLFRLETPGDLTASALEAALAERRFRPCGPLETATLGWASPLGEETAALVHGVGDCLLLCARQQQRLLPSAAIAEALDERIEELEHGENRDVGRAERKRLREQLVTELLPRALTCSRRIRLYLDTQAGWMVVDSSSEKQAEEVVSLLRETLGSLPATRPDPSKTPATVMTGWLLEGTAPPDFVAGETCELRASDDSGRVVRCSGHDLASEEILNHLRAGDRVTKLALEWDERLSFVLAEDLSLTRLRVADALQEEMGDTDLEPAARLDAEFALLSLQMRPLIARLDAVFGLTDATDRAAQAA